MTTLLVPYDPNWPALFEAEAIRLRRALGPLAVRIDHHGSTAVPGLSAKPVIDIQISVINLSPLDSYSQPLATLGYVHVPHADDRFCPFFHRPHEWPHSHHVHVVRAGGEEERRTLAFCDYLRRHESVAREYERLKQQLMAEIHPHDHASREAYARGKTEFVERIVAIAVAEPGNGLALM
jgi:GrpB-like predicted nucleotidyltransferase (UPF0157 family)